MERPIAIDLYCGLGGWAEGFLAEDYEVIGFDIERHDYGTGGYPGLLVLQDVLTICGEQFRKIAHRIAVIVASPPCTEYSYMAMPWKRAKQIARALRDKDEFPAVYKGSRSVAELNALFNACFRIQKELCEVAGRHIPLIVENVKGAQPWVGRAPWNFGSFYLWGDVPALMPIPRRAQKVPGFRFDGSGKSFQSESVKVTGQNWRHFREQGKVSAHWRMEAQKTVGHLNIRDGHSHTRHLTNFGRMGWSNSVARARASAEIAKIPFPLAHHIARVFCQGEKHG